MPKINVYQRRNKMETVEYRDLEIGIDQDEFSEGPREWDNLGTMVCAHRRYTLGDEQYSNSKAGNWDEAMAYYFADMSGINYDEYLTEAQINKVWKWIEKNIVWLPLYLYDHSGITMNTTGFSCPWDSGKVGFIFTTKENIRKEYNIKSVTKEWIKKIEGYLKNEVDTYDDYLTGNVYGYVVKDTDGEIIDSCCGYYGYDHEKSGLLEAAKGYIDWYLDEREGAQLELKFG